MKENYKSIKYFSNMDQVLEIKLQESAGVQKSHLEVERESERSRDGWWREQSISYCQRIVKNKSVCDAWRGVKSPYREYNSIREPHIYRGKTGMNSSWNE